MLYNFNFYSSLLLISFTHGMIFSFLMFKKAYLNEDRSAWILGLFLFVCSLYIAPWMLGFAGWYDNQPYRDILFYVPFLHPFFIGPLIYFYTQSLLNPAFKIDKKQFLHLIPGILYLLYSLIVFITDKLVLKSYYFYANGSDKDFALWYQIAGFVSMTSYFLLSIRYYQLYRALIVQWSSFADRILFSWIKNYLYAFLVMLIVQFIFYIAPYFIESFGSYVGAWWHYLFFSLVLYYIAVSGYANPVSSKLPFEITYIEKRPVFLLPNQSPKESETLDVSYMHLPAFVDEETEVWKEKIVFLIESEQLYENPNLTILDIAQKLETHVNLISKTINQGFLMNFNDFINRYRVEAVKNLLDQNVHKKNTLLGIAFMCGFNSKATFNRAFKKHTGKSPKVFVSEM
uniref:helix-turn-helix domain-containing protein n=1 Tax=Flavobacterium sp. TaxID=239 RepID=UPI00404B4537